ncbi:MAG: glycosyltransferase family 9 protein [Candidatus Xenobia bacterium]
MEPARILICKTKGGIGDAVVSTPVLSVLRRRYPQARLVVLAGSHNREVFHEHPAVDDVWVDDGGAFWPVWHKLARERFDLAVILWSTARLAYLTWLARIPTRVGRTERVVPRLLLNVPARIRPEHDQQSHWMEFLLDHLRTLGIEPEAEDLRPVLALTESARAEAEALLARRDASRPLIAVHSGKGIDLRGKAWPHELFAGVADLLAERHGADILLTGGPAEVPLVAAVQQSMRHPAINAAGRCGLKTLAALYSHCSLLVTPDSGPMHIAAAMGVPILATFNLKADLPFRWYPLQTRHAIVRQPTTCQDDCIKERCRHFTCMRELSAPQIADAATRILQGGGVVKASR